MILFNKHRTFDRLRQYALDHVFQHFYFFRDIRLDGIHKGVDALHRFHKFDQVLVRGDLVSDYLYML